MRGGLCWVLRRVHDQVHSPLQDVSAMMGLIDLDKGDADGGDA